MLMMIMGHTIIAMPKEDALVFELIGLFFNNSTILFFNCDYCPITANAYRSNKDP